MAAAEEVDYIRLSKQGVTLMLNNDWKQAEELFNKHKYRVFRLFSVNSIVRKLLMLLDIIVSPQPITIEM